MSRDLRERDEVVEGGGLGEVGRHKREVEGGESGEGNRRRREEEEGWRRLSKVMGKGGGLSDYDEVIRRLQKQELFYDEILDNSNIRSDSSNISGSGSGERKFVNGEVADKSERKLEMARHVDESKAVLHEKRKQQKKPHKNKHHELVHGHIKQERSHSRKNTKQELPQKRKNEERMNTQEEPSYSRKNAEHESSHNHKHEQLIYSYKNAKQEHGRKKREIRAKLEQAADFSADETIPLTVVAQLGFPDVKRDSVRVFVYVDRLCEGCAAYAALQRVNAAERAMAPLAGFR